MLKPEFPIKDRKGRNEKKEEKENKDSRSKIGSKKTKDRRKNRIIPDQYRKPGKRTEDLLTR